MSRHDHHARRGRAFAAFSFISFITWSHVRERAALALSEPPPATDVAHRDAPAPSVHDDLTGDFADPFVVADEGGYLAFATGFGDVNIQVARSHNLASWTRLPDALPVLPQWASRERGLTWAPSVLHRRNGYVLYYTARDATSGFQCIGRATSSRPEGPYTDDSSHAFICPVEGETAFCGAIDASPFVNDDGSAWLLWKSDENSAACRHGTRIWSEPLDADGLVRTGKPTALLGTDRTWEGPLVEGPSMVRDHGTYYLFYSANDYESAAYAVGYAVCDSPTGPCHKAQGDTPFVRSHGAQLGPGGQEIFRDAAGRSWMAYHAWTAPFTTYAAGGARSLQLAPIDFSDGTPRLGDAPTDDVPPGANDHQVAQIARPASDVPPRADEHQVAQAARPASDVPPRADDHQVAPVARPASAVSPAADKQQVTRQ